MVVPALGGVVLVPRLRANTHRWSRMGWRSSRVTPAPCRVGCVCNGSSSGSSNDSTNGARGVCTATGSVRAAGLLLHIRARRDCVRGEHVNETHTPTAVVRCQPRLRQPQSLPCPYCPRAQCLQAKPPLSTPCRYPRKRTRAPWHRCKRARAPWHHCVSTVVHAVLH